MSLFFQKCISVVSIAVILTTLTPISLARVAGSDIPPADTIKPTVQISMSNTSFSQRSNTANVTFTFSEAPLNFSTDDITVQNGTIDTLATSENPLVFTATFTANSDMESTENYITTGTEWSDTASNQPAESTQSAIYSIDTRSPRISIIQSETQADPTTNPAMTFTLFSSEEIFYRGSAPSCSNVVVTNGACSNIVRVEDRLSFASETEEYSYSMSVIATDLGGVIVTIPGDGRNIQDNAGNFFDGLPYFKDIDNSVLYIAIVDPAPVSRGGGGSVVSTSVPVVENPAPINESNPVTAIDPIEDGELICKGTQENGNWYRSCPTASDLTTFSQFYDNVVCEGFITKNGGAEPIARQDVASVSLKMKTKNTTRSMITPDMYTNNFTDIEITSEYLPIIETSLVEKIITPSRTVFEPTRTATRSESYAMVMASVCLVPSGTDANWQKNLYTTALKAGLTGKTWEEFFPNSATLWQDLAVISARAADWAEQTGGCNPKPAECLVENV